MAKRFNFRIPGKSKSKYRNSPTTVDGIRFDSKKEAEYYKKLKLLQESGEVSFFLRQVPIHFSGGKYVADFLVVYADGTAKIVDVKGVETEVFKLKKRIIEAEYPFEITVV